MIKWFVRNWGLKLFSLVLAIGLWHYAVGEEGIEVTRTIPLDIKVKNSQMSILKTSTHSVQVTFVAPRALLSDMTSQDIRAVHEIGNEVKHAGDYSFRLEPREIQIPTLQIRVTKIEPEVVGVTLDELIVQKLAIQPNFIGEPAFGYTVSKDEIQLNPNAGLIEGPKGKLEKMESIKTEKIDLVGRTRSFRRTVAVELPDYVKLLSEGLIDVYIPIREQFDERTFENILVKVLRPSGGNEKIELKPAKISFTLKGPKRLLDKLVAEKILAYVETADLPAGEQDVPVQILLPEGVSLKDGNPVTVKVNIKK